MSNQNRFLLPSTASSSASRSYRQNSSSHNNDSSSNLDLFDQENNQHSVDTDFDSYWEEEARNPHRNRIRIGRQYQATVPPLLKSGEKDTRKLDDLETLTFCPKRSARLSDTELDHYFTVAKSLNLFASLVETRSLLGRDVTIADLNHIRHKEGLSLASVIQPVRQVANSNPLPLSSSQQSSSNNASNLLPNTQQSPHKSPPNTNCDKPSSSASPKDQAGSNNYALNQPLMKALSLFINLHHPCHHDRDCKKLLKDIPLGNESAPVVSITSGNLRQGSSSTSKEFKPGRSRSSLKQSTAQTVKEESDKEHDDHQSNADSVQSPSYDDWTREEVELFSKAIEVCGKNFSSIKKEFLPSKSVKSIVEYYYIGSREASESKKKSSQSVETNDGCSSPEKSSTNNNGQGGGGGGSGGGGSSASGKSGSSASTSHPSSSNSNTAPTSQSTTNNDHNKTLSDSFSNHEANDMALGSKNEALELNGERPKTKNIDARMSVYNFDEDIKEDTPMKFECPRPGAEVRPLKAKPIIPNAALDSDATNSNVGSLKFFMDGQLVLKLNACQEQQEGIEKCHWVPSGDKVIATNKQKRYTKRAEKSSDQNYSQSNSVVSSYQDEDSKNGDLTGDEDSKESMNSFTNLAQHKNLNISPNPKRLKVKNETSLHQQISPNIDYNRIAVNNHINERIDNLNSNPAISQAMPWFQANSLAVAAALLGQLPFPPTAGNMIDNSVQDSATTINMASKPMDLSLEHNAPRSIQKSSSRSRNRPK